MWFWLQLSVSKNDTFFSNCIFNHFFQSKQKPKENITEFHMVTPARRREPRFGKRRIGSHKPLPLKGYKKRKAEKAKPCFSSSSNVFSESDISCYDQGGAERNKTDEDNNEIEDESVDIVQDSLTFAEGTEVCYVPISYFQ